MSNLKDHDKNYTIDKMRSKSIDFKKILVGIDFNITNCSFTNRMSTPDIYREEYNWRMTENPTALSSVITYTTT